MRYKLGIDIGGTFTDLVLLSSDGQTELAKVASRSDDPGSVIREGCR